MSEAVSYGKYLKLDELLALDVLETMSPTGSKTGTGGSAGSAYLRTTLNHALFLDLWEIRSRL